MNKKGFAISIILYSIVFLVIAILYLILGVMKTRNDNNTKMRNEIINQMNSSNTSC